MKIPRITFAAVLCVLSLAAAPRRTIDDQQAAQKDQAQQSTTITLLDTTDSHGHIDPWDYSTGQPANLGLAKIATLIKAARVHAPDALLLDCGDTTEGTPFAYYFARKDTAKPNPEVVAFNAMNYDAMAVGNHEFNFGLDEMWKAKGESHFPWLAANIKQTYTSGFPYIRPYIIKQECRRRTSWHRRIRYSRNSPLGDSQTLRRLRI